MTAKDPSKRVGRYGRGAWPSARLDPILWEIFIALHEIPAKEVELRSGVCTTSYFGAKRGDIGPKFSSVQAWAEVAGYELILRKKGTST